MANLAKILEDALKVAQAVSPLVGGPAGAGAVTAAQAVVKLLGGLKGAVGPVDKDKLQQELDKLQAEVNAEIDAVGNKLRGN